MPLLTICVVAYNEAAQLERCLDRCLETFSAEDVEILCVNNGSADDTSAIAHRVAGRSGGRLRVIDLAVNVYFGGGLRVAFREAAGTYAMAYSADIFWTAEDWQPFRRSLGAADVLVGCRRERAGYNALMKLNSWLFPKLVEWLFGLRLRDVNWICVYRTELLRWIAMTRNDIAFNTEILVQLRDLGATFREIDCRMEARTVGKPSASRFRTMYRTLEGLFAVWGRWRARRYPPFAPARTSPVPALGKRVAR